MSGIKGFKELITKLNQFGSKAEDFIKDEIEASGREIELQAKKLAPVDLGKLRQSINYSKTDAGLGAMVSVNVSYAAYQEFGTGGLVNVPEELRELAEIYKGKGVRQINLRPQPFLYPAFVDGRKKLIEVLTKGLAKLSQ